MKGGAAGMRILVISDSHGDTDAIELALSRAEAALALHLGDCAGDMTRAMRRHPETPFYAVCGNCDYSAAAPEELTLELGGKRIYLLHGHTKNVKSGDGALLAAANSRRADIVLYGHTHIPRFERIGGVYLLNPGSAKRRTVFDSRKAGFAVLDLVEGGVRAEFQPLALG